MKHCFLFYEPIPDLGELDRRMGVLASLGYEGVELSASHPPPYPSAALESLTRRHGLAVASFLSGWSYSNEGLCLSSPDAAIRDHASVRLVEYVRYASTLGAIVVVGLMQGLRSDEPDEGVACARIAETLGRVARAAEEAGGRVVLEPVNHLQVGFHNSVREAAALVETVGSPALGYMLDTFHMNIEERSVVGAASLHGPSAGHVHLCETNGGPFGSGGLDFGGVLGALEDASYDGWVSTKIYRKADWTEAARSSAEFLGRMGHAGFPRPSR